jgi:hypothetical protein
MISQPASCNDAMNSIIRYLVGPEILWIILYIIARSLRSDERPLPELRNRRMEVVCWMLPLAGIALGFALLRITGITGWMLLRLGLADLIGSFMVVGTIAGAIDYGDSRNAGVGSLYLLALMLAFMATVLGIAVVALVYYA